MLRLQNFYAIRTWCKRLIYEFYDSRMITKNDNRQFTIDQLFFLIRISADVILPLVKDRIGSFAQILFLRDFFICDGDVNNSIT